MWKIRGYRNTFFQKRTKHVPRFVTYFKFFREKVPKYLEVDYFTLTSIIIMKPYKFAQVAFFLKKFFSPFMFRLNAWKRLT